MEIKKSSDDTAKLQPGKIKTAAEFIRGGGLVIFPTETVYGLGADAFNPDAVARIYSEKGRPGDNPLILHIANADDFFELAFESPDYSRALIKNFWPGPLTLVAKKNPALPAWVGGHPAGKTKTVGIRMSAHPIARALIAEAGVIAAPSANKAGKPSPTKLAHALEDFPHATPVLSEKKFSQNSPFSAFAEKILTLDGGSAIVGLESTVVDITGASPVILRPGAITEEQIRRVVCVSAGADFSDAPRSPGTKYKHYAPNAQMFVVSGEQKKFVSYVKNIREKNFCVLAKKNTAALLKNFDAEILVLGDDEISVAQNFFSRLRECDALGVEKIFVEAVEEKQIGVAIMDRMLKAAGGRVIYV
ncbi:MAG: L-threonylcarbamoyladenylate synthase [Defluviitaleaceae bacterium]|nr:L-threonylcarbamoyladenylate synthase [Defluviitaleaceae bacterium]